MALKFAVGTCWGVDKRPQRSWAGCSCYPHELWDACQKEGALRLYTTSCINVTGDTVEFM